ncbi:MAG TPA: nuclear transport factor 2 family protein [Bacteroidales bacterium]|nr:nuclear transport factor 2 family protein [Bacteroidales bacterium]
MTQDKYIPEMYRMVDAMDTPGFVNLFTADGIFRWANMEPVAGKENITAFLTGFFQSIKAISHTDLEYWQVPGVRFATGNVNYTRRDNSLLRVPFSVILKFKGDLINEFLIFVDTSELYK